MIALGENVSGLAVGDLVISWAWGWGTYAQYVVVASAGLRPVPAGIPPRVASMLAVNPPTGVSRSMG